ncbi:hypothetical protein [Roseofilum casamattae]|uniref:Uncharacterized protein n=1 Tax=Roseofilum casamattae BLCC-M143 TaxID=3022442 RepID=A0ABT7BUA3_9CYAN|nr:hypothetical protein [Roseofilum casamattae]MDJ1182772.1 hypothetical protein [Roseofilum casamattae BLCC-M143]
MILSMQTQLSDRISDIFAAVGARNSISFSEYYTLQAAAGYFASDSTERKSVERVLRAVKRGSVRLVSQAIAN